MIIIKWNSLGEVTGGSDKDGHSGEAEETDFRFEVTNVLLVREREKSVLTLRCFT